MTEGRSQNWVDGGSDRRVAESRAVVARAGADGWRVSYGPDRAVPPDGPRVPAQIHPTALRELRSLLASPGWEGVGYSEFVLRAVAAARLRGLP